MARILPMGFRLEPSTASGRKSVWNQIFHEFIQLPQQDRASRADRLSRSHVASGLHRPLVPIPKLPQWEVLHQSRSNPLHRSCWFVWIRTSHPLSIYRGCMLRSITRFFVPLDAFDLAPVTPLANYLQTDEKWFCQLHDMHAHPFAGHAAFEKFPVLVEYPCSCCHGEFDVAPDVTLLFDGIGWKLLGASLPMTISSVLSAFYEFSDSFGVKNSFKKLDPWLLIQGMCLFSYFLHQDFSAWNKSSCKGNRHSGNSHTKIGKLSNQWLHCYRCFFSQKYTPEWHVDYSISVI